MKHLTLTILVALTLLFSATTRAQSNDYDLTSTIAGGGGQSGGGAYTVDGIAGQADAWTSQGGDYALGGGFFGGGTRTSSVYLPLLRR